MTLPETTTVVRPVRWWQRRWIRAAAVALLLGIYPACATSTPEGSADLNFVLKDADGREVRLADFKGRPLLINFWATWCGPCKVEMPWFIEFSEKYKEQNLAVIGISVDDPPEAIRQFAAEQKVPYPLLVGLGQDAMIAAYGASVIIPVSWLVKPDGTVLVKVQGIHPKDWFESQIQALF